MTPIAVIPITAGDDRDDLMADGTDFGRYLQSVAERDIDLLLMEELHVEADFVAFLVGAVGIADDVIFDGAWHSLNDENGETDLLVRVRSGGQRIGVLIENKINAPAQEAQDQRYHLRGQRSQEAGRFDCFVTVICAPMVYLEALPEGSAYEHRIPYEAIRNWFVSRPGPRARWRAEIVNEAIEQGRRGYIMKVHAGKTAFHMAYWLLVQERFPQFVMARPGPKGPKSDWIRYRGAGFPRGVTLNHKADQSCVDLEFAQTPVTALIEKRNDAWPEDVRILKRGGSAALSVPVPRVDMGEPMEKQIDLVLAALEAADRLAPLARTLDL